MRNWLNRKNASIRTDREQVFYQRRINGERIYRRLNVKFHRRLVRLFSMAEPDETSLAPEDIISDSSATANELVEELLSTDPNAAEAVKRVTEAAKSVAELQMEQARLEQALREAEEMASSKSQAREEQAARDAADTIAAGEVRAAELLLKAAKLEAEMAESQRFSAEISVEKEKERLETGKAGAVGAVGAVVSSVPLVVSTAESQVFGLVQLGGIAISSFLFGLVYRYAVRGDLSNIQLKSGVVAAFGIVRGIGQISEHLLVSNGDLDTSTFGNLALELGESMIIFGFAAVAIEIAFTRKILKPFLG